MKSRFARLGAAAALLPLLVATAPAAGVGPVPSGPAVEEPDSLASFLESLSREKEASFSSLSLDVEVVPEAVLDSLILHYERTGEVPAPADEQDRRWRFSPRLAGFQYSRVEGLNVMPGASLRFPTRPRIEMSGRVGYGTASEAFTWQAGLEARLAAGPRGPRVSVSYGREIEGYGSGDIFGNSATALLLGEDYRDYYLREGGRLSLDLRSRAGEIGLSVRIEDQDSLEAATRFALLRRGDPFRVNPAIDPGQMRALELDLKWGRPPADPIKVRFAGIAAGGGLGGDFDYQSLRLEAAASGTPWRGDLVTLRLAGGLVRGKEVPCQALHLLGGFQTLRGYGINEIPARRFVHLGLDYEIGTDLLRPLPLLRRLKIQFVPFLDGAAVFETQARGEEPVRFDDPFWRFAAGIGFQKNVLGIPGGAGQVRLDVTRRLDRGEETMTYRARITVER